MLHIAAHRLMACMLLTLLALPVAAQEPTPETPMVAPTLRAEGPEPARYRLHPLVAGLLKPLYLTHAGDGSGRLFLVGQTGPVQVLINDVLQPAPFLDLTNLVNQDSLRQFSERGLLGLAFHPEFASNGRFFVHYSDHDGTTVLARYSMRPDEPEVVDMRSRQVLLRLTQPYANHNGGQIAFGPDGYLYFGLGDGGSAGDPLNSGQNPGTLLGSILRLDVDVDTGYAIPPDNPGLVRNLLLSPHIWAWGLRNPWRFSFDRVTGELYIADVGQNLVEEVNVEPADSPGGVNYGWRVMEGSQRYSNERITADMQAPAFEYGHSVGCSITGGYVYRGASLPELDGVYIYGDWCSGVIWGAWRDLDGNWQTRQMFNTDMQISSFGEDEDGELYVMDYVGVLYRLVRA